MPAPETPVLRASGLGHRFSDGVWAFRGIDFSLWPGQIAVLAGRNGAGKTVFAKHLAGLYEPTEGEVFASGIDLRLVKGSLAATVGYVFQDARLQTVGETVLEDVLFGPINLKLEPRDARSRAESSLAACGLVDKADSFVHTLSGGEMRRLAIAGVLAMSPRVVILDEPFVNLDLEGVGAVLRIVTAMADGGISVLVVTHEIEKVLGLASRFAIMDKGKLVLNGEPATVLAAGIESYGLRDPYRSARALEELRWLD